MQWAFSQHGQAGVFRVLAIRATGDAHGAYLADALAAIDGALEVYRAGNAAHYIEMAEPLRADILAEQAKTQAP